MTKEINYTEFIDRYLQDEMTPEEKIWFEKELDGNKILIEELELHRKVNAVLLDKNALDLKFQLDNIHEEINLSTEKTRKLIHSVYRNISLTASLVAVLAILISAYFSNRTYSTEKLYGSFYEPAQSSLSYRSAENSNSQLNTAMDLYEKQEYDKAIALFESILLEDNAQVGINLYSGLSYMELKEYENANKQFQKIIDKKPNPFVESASWYLGVCYILTDERDKAEKVFIELSNADGFYKKDAKKILKHL